MIGYGRQCIDDDDIAAVVEVLRGDALTCGPAIAAFEDAIRAVSGAAHAVAVANGTSALRLMYQVAGLGHGKRIGVPAITFVATANQALLLGTEAVLLDVDPETLLLTPEILERALRHQHLDAVVPVHMAGRLCDLAGLDRICRQHGVLLLEDAAHAFGSTADGMRCGDGSFGTAAIFSFHPVKNITTAEGGAIVTNRGEWAERLRSLRHHGIVRDGFIGDLAATEAGMPWYHEFHRPAGNDRLSDLHAALGVSQCRKLERFKQVRARIMDRYREALADLAWLRLPPPAPGQQPCWHLCAAQIDWTALGMDRRAFFATGAAAGIHFQVHYIPLHHQPVLHRAPRASDLAGADRAWRGLVSLPCHPALPGGDLERVITWLRNLGTGHA